MIEKYRVFKRYPSTIDIEIKQALPLAYVRIDNQIFFLGTNGKLFETNRYEKKDIPFIFGKFSNTEFFKLRKAITKTNFKYNMIKNLFFFPSGRWDIEMYSGIIIKLPYDKLNESLKISLKILDDEKFKKIKVIDLRQKKQIVINE